MKEFEWKFFFSVEWKWMARGRHRLLNNRLLNKSHSTACGTFAYKLMIMKVLEVANTIQGMLLVLAYPPGLGGNILLLTKTKYFVHRHWARTELEAFWLLTRGALLTPWEEKSLKVYLAGSTVCYNSDNPRKMCLWYSSGLTIVAALTASCLASKSTS